MAPNQLETFRKKNALHDIMATNKLGAQIFDCLLFPQHYQNPEFLLTEPHAEQISRYWELVQEGL